jgi:hypothetical protein
MSENSVKSMGLPVFLIENRTLFHKETFDLWQTKASDRGNQSNGRFAPGNEHRRLDRPCPLSANNDERRGERSSAPKPASKTDKLKGNWISRHQSDKLLRDRLLLAQLALLEVFYLILRKKSEQ